MNIELLHPDVNSTNSDRLFEFSTNKRYVNRLLTALFDSNHFPNLKLSEDIDIEWVNFGLINHVLAISNFGEGLPKYYAIMSSLKEQGTIEATKMDHGALAYTQNQYDAQKLLGLTTGTLPTVRTHGIFADSFQCTNVALMVNEAAGLDSAEGTNVPTAEVNAYLYEMNEGELRPIFVVNSSTVNGSAFDHHLRLNTMFNTTNNPEATQLMLHESDRIAINYIDSLTRLWLLTGGVPANFEINAGDGVIKWGNNDIKLITIRGGFGYEIEFEDFLKFLKCYRTKPLAYSDLEVQQSHQGPFQQTSSGKVVDLSKNFRVFSAQQIDRGVKQGIQRFLSPRISENVTHKLLHGAPRALAVNF